MATFSTGQGFGGVRQMSGQNQVITFGSQTDSQCFRIKLENELERNQLISGVQLTVQYLMHVQYTQQRKVVLVHSKKRLISLDLDYDNYANRAVYFRTCRRQKIKETWIPLPEETFFLGRHDIRSFVTCLGQSVRRAYILTALESLYFDSVEHYINYTRSERPRLLRIKYVQEHVLRMRWRVEEEKTVAHIQFLKPFTEILQGVPVKKIHLNQLRDTFFNGVQVWLLIRLCVHSVQYPYF